MTRDAPGASSPCKPPYFETETATAVHQTASPSKHLNHGSSSIVCAATHLDLHCNTTEAMSESPSGFNPIVLTTELEPASSSQLSLGNRTPLVPAELLNCIVTITVSDVRRGFFVDGKESSKKHEGAVVVFEFEFSSQKRRSWNPLNRIDSVKIEISANEEEMEGQENDPAPDGDQEIRILERYPISAKGAGSEKQVKKSVSLALEPSALGISGPSLSASRETESTEVRHVNLSSYANGSMCIIWKLEDKGETERGVPDVFAGAVLLHTDGLPFSLDIKFAAPVLGSLYRGQTKVSVESKHLWERKGRDRWESDWSDFDSSEFQEWVKRKTKNGWAVTSTYGTNDG